MIRSWPSVSTSSHLYDYYLYFLPNYIIRTKLNLPYSHGEGEVDSCDPHVTWIDCSNNWRPTRLFCVCWPGWLISSRKVWIHTRGLTDDRLLINQHMKIWRTWLCHVWGRIRNSRFRSPALLERQREKERERRETVLVTAARFRSCSLHLISRTRRRRHVRDGVVSPR